MTAPKEVIWEAEPHTLAKHELLRRYLEAWFPIISTRFGSEFVYYDGFAGPGRYIGGEPGSPIVAVDVAVTHRTPITGALRFVFVEEDERRARWLEEIELPQIVMPPHFCAHVIHSNFEPALRGMLDDLDTRNVGLVPIFAFVDPFGMSGVPFSLVARLLKRRSCEAFITFMTRDINRFVSVLPEHVNDLLGNPDAASLIQAAPEGAAEARRLYAYSLRKAARFVRFFQMRDQRDCPIYDLFFATNDPLGHERMKDAMWAVDGSGAFRFSEGTDPNQLTLLGHDPGAEVAQLISSWFAGKRVRAEEVLECVSHETRYVLKHTRDALKRMEQPGGVDGLSVVVHDRKADGTPRRRGTFAKGTVITFPSEASHG